LSGAQPSQFVLSVLRNEDPLPTLCGGYTQSEREVPEHLSEVFTEKVQDSRTPLIRTLVIRIGLALRVNFSRILQNQLALKLRVIESSTVQYSVMAFRTSNQVWSKGSEAGTNCKS
jgi:hypothetical protein